MRKARRAKTGQTGATLKYRIALEAVPKDLKEKQFYIRDREKYDDIMKATRPAETRAFWKAIERNERRAQ